MLNSKLLEILKTFSSEEMETLKSFVIKQTDKKDTLSQKLLFFLEKYHPDFDNKYITKESVYKKIFADNIFNNNKLSKLMSELTKIVEDYIIHTRRKANIADEKMQLLLFYFEKNLDKQFNSVSRELKHILNNLPYGSYQNQMKYRHKELLAMYQVKLNVRGGSFYYYNYVYNELYEFLEAEQFKWENISLIDRFNVEEIKRSNGPFFIIHQLINQLLKSNDDAYFFEAMLMVENHLDKFEQKEITEILTSLLNFATLKVNSGNAEYNEQVYRTYNFFIKFGLILNEYNKIAPSAYKNYIHICIKLNKISEAESFLEDYKSFLTDDIKEGVYSFNKAYTLFEKAKYHEVLTILLNIKIDDIYYNLNQRRMIIKTYYELLQNDHSYFDLLQSSINSNKKFVYIQKNIPKIYVDMSKNFFKFLQKIVVNINGDKQSILKIIGDLNTTINIYERLWLLNKLNKML